VSLHHYFFKRHGDGWAHSTPSDPKAARSKEHSDLHWISSSRNAWLHHQERGPGGENIRRDGPDSRANRSFRAVQRSCGHAGTSRMAAHLYRKTRGNLPGAWRTERVITAARYDEQRAGMECAGCTMDAKGKCQLGSF